MSVRRVARGLPWWMYLVTGAVWIVVAWLVLGFDSSSVVAIATLAGIVILAAAVMELFMLFYAPGWKWLHGILAVLFLATGIFALFNPGRTVFWLAAFIGWYLLFKGIADITLAFLTKSENEAWWLGLIVGIVEVLLGFWAAGRFNRSLYTLIVLVAAIALARGITDIIMAFRIRRLNHEVAAEAGAVEERVADGAGRGSGVGGPGGVVTGTA